MRNRYRCDECGCYLDPGEGRLCDECRDRERIRARHAEEYRRAVREGAGGQYEMEVTYESV